MSTHNLCFGAKIRKIGLPLHTLVLLHETGVTWYNGVFITQTCFPDGSAGHCTDSMHNWPVSLFSHMSRDVKKKQQKKTVFDQV